MTRSVIALVLNATYEPLCVVPCRRAVVLVLAQKATVVVADDSPWHSEHLVVPAPSVVRLSHFVRIPYRATMPLTRRGVFERDDNRCAYCSARAETIDHVIPRSRGGGHVWSNVVAACRRCNHYKADLLLAELGWSLRVPARAPSGGLGLLVGHSRRDPCWAPYLVPWQRSESAS